MLTFRDAHWNTEMGALLQGIRENPGDDGRRLVFADWLEEKSGETASEDVQAQEKAGAWAKLIRHQCGCPGPGHWLSPWEEWEIMCSLDPQERLLNGPWLHHPQRGLFSRLITRENVQTAKAEAPLGLETYLYYSGWPPEFATLDTFAEFLCAPAARHATSLNINGWRNSNFCETIAASGIPFQHLTMRGCGPNSNEARNLKTILGSSLPLRSLNLDANELRANDAESIQAIAESTLPLQSLDLGYNYLSTNSRAHVSALQALMQSALPLRHLRLSGNSLGGRKTGRDTLMKAIAQSTLPLETLYLSSTGLNLGNAMPILAQTQLPLTFLDVSWNYSTPADRDTCMRALAEAPGLQRLHGLCIQNCSFTVTNCAPLLEALRCGVTRKGEHREILPSLTVLLTGYTTLDQAFADAIAARRERLERQWAPAEEPTPAPAATVAEVIEGNPRRRKS